MIGAPTPQGYDVSKAVDINYSDCVVTVGFDKADRDIPRFLVRLHYLTSVTPVSWDEVARFDHNEGYGYGHDIYDEGLHIDVSIRSDGVEKVYPRHSTLPANRGKVIRRCVEYLEQHAQYFLDVYEGNISPGGPPPWPDGGELSPMLFTGKRIEADMEFERRGDDMLTKEQLSELLADATGTTADEIERGAAEIEIEPPEEADTVHDE